MDEVWKDVVGYEGRYKISNRGRLFSVSKNRVIIPDKNSQGYLVQPLCAKGKMTTGLIHRLVAKAFLPNPDNLPEVNHKDFDKTNNSVENLEWCTREYNRHHAIENGHAGYRFKKGNKIGITSIGNSKLNIDQVNEIRRRLLSGETGVKLAKEYSVTPGAISFIKVGRTWNDEGGNI